MYPSSGAPIGEEWPPVVSVYSGLVIHIPGKLFREFSGIEHLPHQPRQLRGARGNHGGRSAVVRRTAESLAPTRSVPGCVPILRADMRQAKNSLKHFTNALSFRFSVLPFPCIFGLIVWPYSVLFGSLAVIHLRVPKYRIWLDSSLLYLRSRIVFEFKLNSCFLYVCMIIYIIRW